MNDALEKKRPADPNASPKAASTPPPAPRIGTPDKARPREIGGRDGPDPTRYGDWELNGRCIDF